MRPISITSIWLFALCCAMLGMVLPTPSQAASIQLVTGDYPPFSSEYTPANGVMSEVVVAAFKAQGVTARLGFLPWQRGYKETRLGLHTGTFPYVKNREREQDFLFSKPLYPDVVRLFVLSDKDLPNDWVDKGICVPQGHNIERVAPFIETQRARLERPPGMLNCFQMLRLGRVHAVWSSEVVAEFITRDLRQEGLNFKPMNVGLEYPVELYLIVSRQLPQAQQWIDRFNQGLGKIQKNGVYAQILARHKMSAAK